MDVVANDPMRRFIGPGDAAGDLGIFDPLGEDRKRLRRLIARLHLHANQSCCWVAELLQGHLTQAKAIESTAGAQAEASSQSSGG